MKRIRTFRVYDITAFRRLVWLSGLKGWEENSVSFSVRYDSRSEREKWMLKRLNDLAIQEWNKNAYPVIDVIYFSDREAPKLG